MQTVKNNFKFLALLFLIILLGLYLRINQLASVPISLYWDEVAILVDARSIAKTGLDIHGNNWLQAIYPSYGDFKLPLYIIFTSLLAKISTSDLIVRIPNIIAGVLSIPLIGYLSSLMFSNLSNKKLLFLTTSFVFTVSPWSIMFSRTGFEGFISQFLLMISVIFIFMAKKSQDRAKSRYLPIFLLILVPIFGTLATYSYFSTRFVWPVVFLISYLVAFIFPNFSSSKMISANKKSYLTMILNLIKTNSKYLLTHLLVVFLILISFYLNLEFMYGNQYYEQSQQIRFSTDSVLQNKEEILTANYYREILNNSLTSKILFHRHYLVLKEFTSNFFDHLILNYLFITGDSNLRHGTTKHGLFLISFLPLLFIGLFQLAANHKKELFIVLTWWFVSLVPASVPNTTPHALRSLNALVPIVIIIGFGLYSIFEYINNLSSIRNKKIVQLLIILIILINLGAFYNYYLKIYPENSKEFWQYEAKNLVKTINKNRVGNEKVIVKNIESTLYLWFLAYGNYPIENIQSLEMKNFQLNNFDNIYFVNSLPDNSDSNYIFPERINEN